jgi:hypothetical protein
MRERIGGFIEDVLRNDYRRLGGRDYRSRHELVSKAGNCKDKSRFLGVIVQFLAKAGDVDIHCPSKVLML